MFLSMGGRGVALLALGHDLAPVILDRVVGVKFVVTPGTEDPVLAPSLT